MTIGKKLRMAIVTMLLVAAGMAASAVYSINTMSRELETSTGLTTEKLALAGNLKAAANIMRTGQRGMLLNGFQRDSKGAEATRADYAKKKASALALVASIEPLLLTEEGRRSIDQLKSDIERHAESFRQISDLCDTGKLKEAEMFYKEQGAPAGAAMERTASEMMDQQIKIMSASAEGRPPAASFRNHQLDRHRRSRNHHTPGDFVHGRRDHQRPVPVVG